MAEESNTNITPAVTDAPASPVEPVIAPVAPVEPISTPLQPTPEPVAPPVITPPEPAPVLPLTPTPSTSAKASTVAEAMVDKSVDVPPPADNTVRSLLAKAMAKIQFRKQAKLEKVMVLARERGQITNDSVQKLLRVSDATASRYLAQLVKSGRLRQAGIRGGAVYHFVQ